MIPEVEIDYLCNRHYVVVSADYRLCPQAALSDIIQDAIDAFSWCKSVLPTKLRHDVGIEVDSARIVAFGQSAGSLLALHLVRKSPSSDCLVPSEHALRSSY